MKLTNPQIIYLSIGIMLLMFAPPIFFVYTLIIVGVYLVKHLNPYNKANPIENTNPYNPDDPAIMPSPTAQTFFYLRKSLHPAQHPENNQEKETLSDYEKRAWETIVRDIREER